MLTTALYFGDLAVGFGLPICVHVAARGRPWGGRPVELFWLGVVVGLTWEVPLFLSAAYGSTPVLELLGAAPAHELVFLVSHALWDGGLFLAGVWLVQIVAGRASGAGSIWQSALRELRWRDFAVLVLYGQASELLVEVIGIAGGMWSYVLPHPANVGFAELLGHPLTLLPQGIWLVAPMVYYVAAVGLARRRERRESRSLAASSQR